MKSCSLPGQPPLRRCILLLLYWPLYGLVFRFAEQTFSPGQWNVMHCPMDDLIPFCEVFLIPYLFWFLFLAGIHVYTFFAHRDVFEKLMWFIILSYTIGLLIFFLYPSVQHLRPAVLPRDNLLTRMTAAFYRHDTNTNVCPSLHVVGSMAVWYAARETPLFRKKGWRLFFHTTTLLICLSTLFLKQHSIIDVLMGLTVSHLVYRMVYRRGECLLPEGVSEKQERLSC